MICKKLKKKIEYEVFIGRIKLIRGMDSTALGEVGALCNYI